MDGEVLLAHGEFIMEKIKELVCHAFAFLSGEELVGIAV
jgi:hypothetical protein